jgi:hypothetical protein
MVNYARTISGYLPKLLSLIMNNFLRLYPEGQPSAVYFRAHLDPNNRSNKQILLFESDLPSCGVRDRYFYGRDKTSGLLLGPQESHFWVWKGKIVEHNSGRLYKNVVLGGWGAYIYILGLA